MHECIIFFLGFNFLHILSYTFSLALGSFKFGPVSGPSSLGNLGYNSTLPGVTVADSSDTISPRPVSIITLLNQVLTCFFFLGDYSSFFLPLLPLICSKCLTPINSFRSVPIQV